MRTILYLIHILGLLLLIQHAQANEVNKILSLPSRNEQVVAVLELSKPNAKDTTYIQNIVKPLLKHAKSNNNSPLEWACHMLSADSYSMAFDYINPRSDYHYNEAEKLFQHEKFKELAMAGHIRRGTYYFTYQEIRSALPYFLKANELRDEVTKDQIPLIDIHYDFIARFYNFIGARSIAVNYLKDALPYTPTNGRKRINMLNTIGLCLFRDSSLHEADIYYRQALDVAILDKDTVWVGIIDGNLADVKWKQGKKNEAIQLIKSNFESSVKYDERLDAMRAGIMLSEWLMGLDNHKEAEFYLNSVKGLLDHKPYFLPYRVKVAKLWAELESLKGNHDQERKFLKQYIVLRDSLEERNNKEAIQQVTWQWETERFQNSLNAEALRREEIKKRYQIFALFFILIFIITVLLINRSRARIKIRNANLEKNQLIITHEKELVDRELIILKNSLEEFTETIKQNDVVIEQLRNSLQSDRQADNEVLNNLNMMLEAHIMTDDRWLKFKHAFDKVYPDYLLNIKEQNPKLTENDLRLIALTKLGLSNRSMSDLLGVSLEGIKKAKQRLKKKWACADEEYTQDAV